jgi:hypothetical protein
MNNTATIAKIFLVILVFLPFRSRLRKLPSQYAASGAKAQAHCAGKCEG